jgi:hypothetical protein
MEVGALDRGLPITAISDFVVDAGNAGKHARGKKTWTAVPSNASTATSRAGVVSCSLSASPNSLPGHAVCRRFVVVKHFALRS